VDDLEKLGLRTEGIVGKKFEHGAVAFFDLQSRLKLAIWKREDIAYDTKINQVNPSPTEFTIGHNVGSQEEVDEVMNQAEKAGVRITVQAHDTFWCGYSRYFQDPNGFSGFCRNLE
jgi:uncharacterized protein